MAIKAVLASGVPRNARIVLAATFLRMTLLLYTLAHARSVCATKNSQPVLAKTTQMHDIVIGLFVNRYAFGRAV
jgi:hypothetical protein